MYLSQFKDCIPLLFGELLQQFKDCGEYGFNFEHSRKLYRIGYCTNLTPEIVDQAKEKNIDLIITHHDAWDFVFGMKEACITKLSEYGIGHFYIHLPLDYVDFGTCNTLMKEIGDITIIRQSQHIDGDSVIGVGELTVPMEFHQLVDRVSHVLSEEIKTWNFGSPTIRRIGMITGAGDSTAHVKEAQQLNCDVYITGEKSLYTVQYAKFIGMNLIVGSHTFTEIFGVRSFANKIKQFYPHIEVIQLEEEHIE